MVNPALKVCAVVALGALEGAAFATCGIVVPYFITAQMSFRSMLVMKLFLAAVGSSMLCQSLLRTVSPTRFDRSRNFANFNYGYRRVVIGCATLGCGMYLSGSGPTMLPAQLASLSVSAPAVCTGMLLGGALYDIIDRHILAKHSLFVCPTATYPTTKLIAEQLTGGTHHHYVSWAAPMGSVLVGGAILLEVLFPHRLDVQSISPLPILVPTAVGGLIGVNQVLLRLMTECGMGGSRAVMSLVALLTGGQLCSAYYPKQLDDLWQLLYVWAGTLIGAGVVTALRGAPHILTTLPSAALLEQSPASVLSLHAFVGGVLMMLGARFAGACTCGHGITGFSELSLQSSAGAASIFAGGIAAAMVMRLA